METGRTIKWDVYQGGYCLASTDTYEYDGHSVKFKDEYGSEVVIFGECVLREKPDYLIKKEK